MKIHGLYVPGEGWLRTAIGTRVTKKVIIAGDEAGAVFRDSYGLAAHYGGQPERWQKMRGEAVLVYKGRNRRSEVHWAQEKNVGPVEEKFVRWLEK